MSALERRVQILLDKEQYAQVEREAQRTKQSVAAVIRQAISERLATRESVRAAAARRLLATADQGPGEDWGSTKAALASLARSWAAESIRAGVTVNVVSPAATDTPMLVDPARAQTAPKLPPIGRLIQPAEVAALVAFLLSDEAAAITGQDIAVCGGASVAG